VVAKLMASACYPPRSWPEEPARITGYQAQRLVVPLADRGAGDPWRILATLYSQNFADRWRRLFEHDAHKNRSDDPRSTTSSGPPTDVTDALEAALQALGARDELLFPAFEPSHEEAFEDLIRLLHDRAVAYRGESVILDLSATVRGHAALVLGMASVIRDPELHKVLTVSQMKDVVNFGTGSPPNWPELSVAT
jgi:hypothetical protein